MGNVRTRRTVEEKRQIVELTLEPGAILAQVAQAEGVNAAFIASQVGGLFPSSRTGPLRYLRTDWRRLYARYSPRVGTRYSEFAGIAACFIRGISIP